LPARGGRLLMPGDFPPRLQNKRRQKPNGEASRTSACRKLATGAIRCLASLDRRTLGGGLPATAGSTAEATVGTMASACLRPESGAAVTRAATTGTASKAVGGGVLVSNTIRSGQRCADLIRKMDLSTSARGAGAALGSFRSRKKSSARSRLPTQMKYRATGLARTAMRERRLASRLSLELISDDAGYATSRNDDRDRGPSRNDVRDHDPIHGGRRDDHDHPSPSPGRCRPGTAPWARSAWPWRLTPARPGQGRSRQSASIS
jgi:hypothetical protein